MQYWPRKRAAKPRARVRSWASSKDAKALGFAGYKVGMTHVIYKDEDKNSPTKGENVMVPVTIIECPPIHVVGVRSYKQATKGRTFVAEVMEGKQDKNLARTIKAPKKAKGIETIKPEECDEVVLLVHTKPAEAGFGKKRPEIFELPIGGKKDDQIAYAKEVFGKDIAVGDVFQEGEFLDAHAVTTGRGFQGAVKRFGINLKPHKSEKGRRAPGSLGPWVGQQHIMYRVAHAGQTGYHQRTTYNLALYKIGDKPEEINAKGGFIRYGQVKSSYVLIKGSVQGTKKRLITLTKASRPDPKRKPVAPKIHYISTESQQG